MTTLELRPYQNAAIDGLYQYFSEHAGNPLVVIPTAGGKSLVIAKFTEEVITKWPDQRVIAVTHVKELIEQNFLEFVGLVPFANAGIYSAGLNSRNTRAQVLFAGIQSVWDKAYQLQRCDLLLVDEAHLIPTKDGVRYRRFITDMLVINPSMKVIGFTATPYRLGTGMLHEGEGALFNGIAYEISMLELIEQGYLSPLVSKQTNTKLDVSGVGSSGGDFKPGELEAAVDIDSVTQAAVSEMVERGLSENRVSWLAFCAGADHAMHVRDALRGHGIATETILGTTPKGERTSIINAYRAREIRALTSMGVLTTGFNVKSVDLIAMLRPTKSAGLYVQIAGRGCRLSPETNKTNCMVLDFAGNVARHGPVDAVRPKKPGAGGGGEAPVKTCPECQSITHASSMECADCGYVWPPPPPEIVPVASTLAIMSNGGPNWKDVTDIHYDRHEKEGKPPSMRVEYQISLAKWQREWICFEHSGYARMKAIRWWQQRGQGSPVPNTVDEALSRTGEIVVPTAIGLRPAGKFDEIVDYQFGEGAMPKAMTLPWLRAKTAVDATEVASAPVVAPMSPAKAAFFENMKRPRELAHADDDIPF